MISIPVAVESGVFGAAIFVFAYVVQECEDQIEGQESEFWVSSGRVVVDLTLSIVSRYRGKLNLEKRRLWGRRSPEGHKLAVL